MSLAGRAPAPVLPVARVFDVEALVEVFAEWDEAALARQLAEHVPDRTGHCAGCRGQVPPRSPCTIQIYVAEGQRLARNLR